MHALIMAGGSGSRLNRGEKPLISLCGRPMISYVIEAFSAGGFDPVVAASPNTPMTMNWCRAQGIAFCRTEGRGYVEDMIGAVEFLDDQRPLFVCVSDIPCITPKVIRQIADAYHISGKEACSAWVPADHIQSYGSEISYKETINGIEACPAGVNILRGDLILQPQEELQILLSEPGLALNVNTMDALAKAEEFIKRQLFM
ncbi:MAG: NTP transferase domain-containing protein [Methanoregula sp.]|nr:NTP transferase domain-containing protein [Methanoregula sp.]